MSTRERLLSAFSIKFGHTEPPELFCLKCYDQQHTDVLNQDLTLLTVKLNQLQGELDRITFVRNWIIEEIKKESSCTDLEGDHIPVTKENGDISSDPEMSNNSYRGGFQENEIGTGSSSPPLSTFRPDVVPRKNPPVVPPRRDSSRNSRDFEVIDSNSRPGSQAGSRPSSYVAPAISEEPDSDSDDDYEQIYENIPFLKNPREFGLPQIKVPSPEPIRRMPHDEDTDYENEHLDEEKVMKHEVASRQASINPEGTSVTELLTSGEHVPTKLGMHCIEEDATSEGSNSNEYSKGDSDSNSVDSGTCISNSPEDATMIKFEDPTTKKRPQTLYDELIPKEEVDATCDLLQVQIDDALAKKYSTPDVEDLNLRRIILGTVLDSEKKYITSMECLLTVMKVFSGNMNTSQPILSSEDYSCLFYKIAELCQVHQEFRNNLEARLKEWTPDQTFSDLFQFLEGHMYLHEEYASNYQQSIAVLDRCRKENPQFNQIAENIKMSNGEAATLESLLYGPLQKVTKLTLVLHDLLRHTPEIHPDYQIMKEVHDRSNQFLQKQSFEAPRERTKSFKARKRYLIKESYLVEWNEGERRLRHVLLWNDVIICAAEKSTRAIFTQEKQKGQYECKWCIPLTEISLSPFDQSEAPYHFDVSSSLYSFMSLSTLATPTIQSGEPVVKMTSAEDIKKLRKELTTIKTQLKRASGQRNLRKNATKHKKTLQELEATMVMASPNLPFHLYHQHGKTYTLLMSSDYERIEWREAIAKAKRECTFTPSLTSFHLDKVMAKCKRTRKVNHIGSILLKDDEESLSGILKVVVLNATGLSEPKSLSCVIEVDSYGMYSLMARTNSTEETLEPEWNKDFDLEVDGARSIRIICYENKNGKTEFYDRGFTTLPKAKQMRDKHEQFVMKMEKIEVKLSAKYTSAHKTLKRVQSKRKLGVFGVRIQQVIARERTQIPNIVSLCIQEVEKRGLEETGIYRISGSSGDVAKLKNAFENHHKSIESMLGQTDIHAVAGLMKLYFRELPEPLFTDILYPKLVEALNLTHQETKVNTMKSLVKRLPTANQSIVFALFNHIKRVSERQKVNKMSLQNMATVFGPTLLGPGAHKPAPGNPLQSIMGMSDVMSQVGILAYLLEHCFL
ncbi:active breakpoint cluster region-related protein-like isoform X2 [Anneissia japonica]|uniref:active breakpoint cluster region-related protein-like isoform X2 n=1 Tax=Anneissia japonica TaxID=1529436 RepID=UPI001425840E|nr:active breakpoint cluster region-related protein-like isoform X2 [Anneissia japonica]